MATATGDPHTDALAEMIERLHACLAQARLYGPHHAETVRALGACHQSMTRTTHALGTIELRATQEGFEWRGVRVTQERDDRPGIARHLHTEGIHTLRFDPGVTDVEIVRLMDVLRVNLSLPDYEEETLESLLYQAEFQHVGYRAVAALMEAESLSGRAEQDMAEQERRLRAAIELQRSDSEIGRDLGATARGETLGMSEQDARIWRLMQQMAVDEIPEEDEDWRNHLIDRESDDGELLARIRTDVANERESEILARIVSICLRAAASEVAELPSQTALKLASDATRQIYALGDAVGVARVIDDCHRLAERVGSFDATLRERIRTFLAQHIHPLRIARMLRSLNPANPVERGTLERFLRLLPETAILAFVEGTMRDEDRRAVRALLVGVWRISGARLLNLLQNAQRMGPDLLVPLLYMMATVNAAESPQVRGALLTHPAGPVREAALQLYDTIPPAEARGVVVMLFDRVSSVRRAAAELLRRHRPPEALPILVATLQAPEFVPLDRGVKTDLCITAGRLGGMNVIPVLEALLNTRTGLTRSDSDETTIEAAAMGLAATRNPNAARILEKGARAWAGAIRSACVDALAQMERDV
jgi:hypothetical protein